ncbi:Golgin subfamily A member 2 [Nymphon striatum]|nr:Golgin subfamily A member 2 [Nymphon striatum]
MADMSRVQKLASARKKLKQFQKSKKPATVSTVKENILVTSTSDREIEQTESFFDVAKKAKCGDDSVGKFENHCSQNVYETAHIFHELNNGGHNDFEHKYKYEASTLILPKESMLKQDDVPVNSFLNFECDEKSSNSNSSQSNEATQVSILDKCDYSLPTAAETSPFDNSTQQPKLEFSSPSSSTESLRQISLTLNGLMNESEQFLNGDEENLHYDNKKELEQRNQELASTFQHQKQITQQLSFEVQQLKNQNSVLQTQFDKERQDSENRTLKEISSLKEQLQVHIQTIGILVAEKTELQSALSQSQRAAKQKTGIDFKLGEVEELDGRLKASRQRLTDLDKELQNIRSSRNQFENDSKKYSKEVDRLKLELYKLKKSCEENRNENSELVQKLQIKSQDNKKLDDELVELKKKLSLSVLRVQQLSSNYNADIQSQLEQLNETNIELESRVSQYKESFQKLSTERDSLTEQYQQYIQQLNQQIISVRDELDTTVDECKKLEKENNLLSSQKENVNIGTGYIDSEKAKEFTTENIKLVNDIKELELKNKQILEQLESQVQDNNQISQLMDEKENRLQELEGTISRLQEEEVDKGKLLDTIQSDKVAASRAMTQNKQLKKQLEELQEGFVQMSNDKLELTEKMMSQQHMGKELGEQILQQTEEIHGLKQKLTEKNQEMEALSKEIYQHNQINDRMRHFEAQGQLSETLQTELHQAQDQISALTTQNNKLRSMLTQQVQTPFPRNDTEGDSESKKDSLVASLSASVQQLELERDQLLRQLEEQKANYYNVPEKHEKLDSKPKLQG